MPRMTLATKAVLRALLSGPEAEFYGLQIAQLTDQPSGTVTPILARLTTEGWLAVRREDVDPREAGRPVRNYYRLTDKGTKMAAEQLGQAMTRPARAFHDLNGVTTLVITGWRGEHVVRPHAADDRGVSIIAPRRHEGEEWTFQRVTLDGVLRCHSSLIGSPALLTDTGEPMVILLPGGLIDSIDVQIEAEYRAKENER